MVPAALLLLILFAAAIALVAVATVGLSHNEQALDAHLHDPDTPTVRWSVPEGVDPAVVAGVLVATGFPAVLETDAGSSWLRIECRADEHDAVREVIEKVYLEEYAPALRLPPVTFRDAA